MYLQPAAHVFYSGLYTFDTVGVSRLPPLCRSKEGSSSSLSSSYSRRQPCYMAITDWHQAPIFRKAVKELKGAITSSPGPTAHVSTAEMFYANAARQLASPAVRRSLPSANGGINVTPPHRICPVRTWPVDDSVQQSNNQGMQAQAQTQS
ncbi:hypothetical protein JB92DRAFT_2838163 [Gautieria morchelliformis]|nr:hypothetical protein JB92DRAFT_2838163 [Gautieria morchelliformis]